MSRQQDAYLGAVYKVLDVIEAHGEGVEGQHHALLHNNLLEAVASLAHAVPSAVQVLCRRSMAHCRLPCNTFCVNSMHETHSVAMAALRTT